MANHIFQQSWQPSITLNKTLWMHSHASKLQALCPRSWHLRASPQRSPQRPSICVHLSCEMHLSSENKKRTKNMYTNKVKNYSLQEDHSQVTVSAIGRVSWVNAGNAGSAAILRSRKTGKTCKGGNATAPMIHAPTTSHCTFGSNTTKCDVSPI